MTVRLNPYLNFKGKTREAMTFYQSVFGGELTMSTFADFQAPVDPSESDLIMHSQLEGEGGVVLMAADATSQFQYVEGLARYSCSLSGDDEALLTTWWEGLSEGATIDMPLDKAPWGDSFGSLTDRYGIAWLVNIAGSR